MRLHTQNAASETIHAILTGRGEYVRPRKEDALFPDPDRTFSVSPLFHGFPSFYDDFGPIVIETGNSAQPMRMSVEAAWAIKDDDLNGMQRSVSRRKALLEELPGEPALVVQTEEKSYVTQLEYFRGFPRFPGRNSERARMPCQVVRAHSESVTEGSLLDEAFFRGEEEEAIKVLQIIDPQITDVRVTGGDSPDSTRRVFIRSDRFARPVPLRSFGDGLNRLFIIILSLLEARGGLLLIDEFENGLHHSVQLKVWRTIFKLAKDLNVQVFATTHSRDAVEQFHQAASESPEEGMLLLLVRRDDDIIPTVFVNGVNSF